MCPFCGGDLRYRDHRKRTLRREGGEKNWLQIRRFRCSKCQKYHNELPDCILPYKHYEAEVISGVLDEIVTSDDADSEDYPSFMTIHRWIDWFVENLSNIEGYLRSAQYRLWRYPGMHCSAELHLEVIRAASQKWLEDVMRMIYNSGGYLPAVYR